LRKNRSSYQKVSLDQQSSKSRDPFKLLITFLRQSMTKWCGSKEGWRGVGLISFCEVFYDFPFIWMGQKTSRFRTSCENV